MAFKDGCWVNIKDHAYTYLKLCLLSAKKTHLVVAKKNKGVDLNLFIRLTFNRSVPVIIVQQSQFSEGPSFRVGLLEVTIFDHVDCSRLDQEIAKGLD